MKLAVTIAGENAKESAFVVWRGFEESLRKAAEYGYDGVELALKSADDINPDCLSNWLDKYKLEVSCISTGQVFADLGLYFTHPDPQVRDKTIGVFTGLVKLAGDFGKIINIGRTRGFVAPGQTPGEAENLFTGTIKQICEIAAKYGVTIILEPVNRYEINFINNLDQGAELLSKIGLENCGLMPDVFHMNIEDDRIGESLIRNSKWVRYIHLADSNRWAPGWGHIDFDEVFSALKKISYDGWVSVEILPNPEPDLAAKQAIEFLRPKIREYNQAKLLLF